MTHLVFFLEEPSAREMLQGVLPKVLPEHVTADFIVFEGKQDLEKRLPRRLRAWRRPDSRFVVVRDQDAGDCYEVKQKLAEICRRADRPEALVRIACHELESFYLGDLAAVTEALGGQNLAKLQHRAKYRNPDRLHSPKRELKQLAPSYQPLSGSRAIAALLDPQHNHSHSFRVLVDGIRNLAGAVP